MDRERFDALAKRLAARLSRRSAIGQGGAGLAAFAAGALGIRGAAGAQEVCTDPDRPGVGCACTTGTENPCGDTTLVCCKNDPDGPPGSPGTCTPAAVGSEPTGPTPTPAAPCAGRGCRCQGGVEGACDRDLVCCPDNPGLPGGPGRCLREAVCNRTNCRGEGCACHSGVRDACEGRLVCCADDPSLPGGPGRCEAEEVCFSHQCQATTNPCPAACAADAYCERCCSGHCGSDGHCAAAPCAGEGCECGTTMQQPRCSEGLICCTPPGQAPGGPGVCTTEAACNA